MGEERDWPAGREEPDLEELERHDEPDAHRSDFRSYLEDPE